MILGVLWSLHDIEASVLHTIPTRGEGKSAARLELHEVHLLFIKVANLLVCFYSAVTCTEPASAQRLTKYLILVRFAVREEHLVKVPTIVLDKLLHDGRKCSVTRHIH